MMLMIWSFLTYLTIFSLKRWRSERGIDKGSLCVFRCNYFKHLLSFDEFDASLPGIGGVQYNVDMSLCEVNVNVKQM